jgi:uncharacterized protein YbjT (DUF2867 family)
VLAAAGEQVTAVSRRPADLPNGVAHRQADLAEPESLRPVLDGAEALFLLVAGSGRRSTPERSSTSRKRAASVALCCCPRRAPGPARSR